jgi:hypothetical protein
VPREQYKNRVELIQGTLDMLVLQTLRGEPQHGYGIAQAIRAGSSDVLQVETGSLTPRYTGWRSRAGSKRNGGRLITTNAPSSIA